MELKAVIEPRCNKDKKFKLRDGTMLTFLELYMTQDPKWWYEKEGYEARYFYGLYPYSYREDKK